MSDKENMKNFNKNDFVDAIVRAMKPEFDRLESKMATKEELITLFNTQAEKIGEWFEVYGKSLKKVRDDLAQRIDDLNK